MKTSSIVVSSTMHAAPDEIWTRLTQTKTLQYIAAPYATFKSADPKQTLIWKEGAIFRFRFRIFGFIPMGIHTIRVLTLDRDALHIATSEENALVPVWNHEITLFSQNDQTTLYTDQVEIGAGRLTGIVRCWALAFYRHRQNKWKRLLQ